MSATCANCKKAVTAAMRSNDNQAYCKDCGDYVYAFRPDEALPEDWYLVCDGRKPEDGETVTGGQCEGCALSEYRIERQSRSSWDARCRGQVADQTFVEGCDALLPVRMKMRHTVILPWSEALQAQES